MKLLQYAPPIAAALLLILFFSALPNLKYCVLPDNKETLSKKDSKSSRLTEVIFLVVLCAVYAFAAFFGLGDTSAPQSFTPMEGNSVILELSSENVPSKIMLYTGVGTGSYEFSCSLDGEKYYPILSFEQEHSDVLKWHKLDIDCSFKPRYIKIDCVSGNPWLGEIVFLDENSSALSISSETLALCDEQELYPECESYMNSSYFDEIYHARTAWEHLNGVWPYEISHPPLGKIIISLGISLFGMTPFGWRFSGTICGVLMLPIMYYLLKRIFRSKTVSALGTIVFASDFMHFVQTRIATIDSFAVFFILLMYLFMYGFYENGNRRDLALSGIFFGLGASSKWTCIYAGAGLAVIWLMYWSRTFIQNKDKLPWKAFIKNCLFCLLFFVAIPCTIYYFSYIPYGIAKGVGPFSKQYTDIVLDNQEFMFSYHVNVQSEHPYASRWYQWILNIRPILYYLNYFEDGTRSSIAAFLNPALCWGGLLSLFVLIYTALFRKDRKAGFILVGYLAQLAPWFFIKRLTFEYHYFASSVFLVLAIAYVFDILRRNRKDWLRWTLSFAAVSLALFVLFYPVLSGYPVDNVSASKLLRWLPTWPL